MPPSAGGEVAAREVRSVHGQVLPISLRGAQDGADDAVVGAAAAEIAGERLAHLGFASAAGCGRAAPWRVMIMPLMQ